MKNQQLNPWRQPWIKLGLTVCWVLLTFGNGESSAADAVPDRRAARHEQIATEVATVAQRLKLTDEQKTQVEPILRDSAERRRAVLEKYRGQRGFKTLRALRQELQPIQKETEAKLEKILDPGQMKEFKAIRAQMRDRWREEFRQRRQEKK